MSERSDRRLAWQPDIYQRYSFLARLTDILTGDGSGALTLLDVGSGPVALTQAFVSPRFEIVRADVGQFDDPSIVRLQPGEPLPFEDAAFDVAVAIEVLEHVPPAQRPLLIRELQRVSRQATIVCCPVDTPDVVEAERQFSAYANAVSGRDVDFLVEHRENGLPDAAEVVSWFRPGSALVADNAPLDEWLAFNTIDFIFACDLGDEAKARFATAVNARAPLARTGAAHYRRFFCAFTSAAHAARASRVIDDTRFTDPVEPQHLVRELVTGMLRWRQEWRERSARDVDAIHRRVGELDAALLGFKDAVATKDAHIGKLDEHLVATVQSLQEAHAAFAEKDARLLVELETNANAAEALASARADFAVKVEQLTDAQQQAEALRHDLAAARDDLQQRTSALSAEHVRLEESTRRTAALERELQVILTSRSWRLTAPLRRFRKTFLYRTLTSPASALANMRRLARERVTRRRNYALAVESGLFDVTWYRECYPDVATTGVDPLVHYLKSGGREGRNPHPLFDSSFYLQSNPDVRDAGVNPLVHYLLAGGFEGRDPHLFFDSSFYLERNPDVAAAGLNPLRHYVSSGASEGRAPHPDFDGAFYLASNPDVAAAGVNPLVHYVTAGRAEGRAAFAPGATADEHEAILRSRQILADSGLFDPAWYLSTYQDVAASGFEPLDHFLASGKSEGRRPTPLFDTVYYLGRYPDVGTSRLNPLVHYVVYGWREGRWVNPAFDSGYYLRTYPDVAASRLTPLAHYIRFGAAECRHPSAVFDPVFYLEANPDVRDAGLSPLEHYVLTGVSEGRVAHEMSVAGAMRGVDGYVPPPGLLPWFSPLKTMLDPVLAATPRLNVLLPGLGMRQMSGGPNTVLSFVGRLAALGIPIRLVSTDAPIDDDPAPFWAHVTALAGGTLPPDMKLVDAHDRSKPWRIGEHDVFFATAWWTAQQVKYATRLTRTKKFVYFIQDFEPLFHAASTAQALAEETYALDYVPILNTRILADFFNERRIGRFADPAFARDAVVFEPALDRALFHPAPRAVRERRRVLFYARPTSGLRNLFELAVAALQQAVQDDVLPPDQWEFLGMGEEFAPVDLGHGAVLRPAPWLGLQEYADQMRESDVLLSLMMSPHPSYPPLEMAACGGVAVTTVYANKDAARLAGMSPRILGVAATIEGLVSGLARAVAMPAAEEPADVEIALPQSWDEAFSAAVPQVATRIRQLMGLPLIATTGGREPVAFPGYHWPRQAYDLQRLRALERRRHEYRSPSHPLLFSVITPVWDTDPAFLEELCLSVLRQDCASDLFEWVVVDNASTRSETCAVLDRWAAADARLRVHRADRNLGILGGLRACLERARGRYVVTVDHDDLLTPDALRVLGHILAARGYPLVAYSDEDKIDGARLRDTYFKPDWDPVLFAHSCYTSHVGVLDRQRALDLGAYTDPGTEGSHDWDSFVRFWSSGAEPVHVPEVLYTWRIHPESTAGNIHSKPYVFDSQRRVLEKLVEAARPAVPCAVVPSALFPGMPDWRLLTDREPRVLTAVFGPAAAPEPRVAGPASQSMRTVNTIDELANAAAAAADQGCLLHLVCRGVDVDEETWAREAVSLLALFQDCAIVGGPLLHKGRVIDGARIAGVGRGLDAVDAGRDALDPGYFAQAWKPHTVDAVPAGHLVVEPSFLLEVVGRLPSALLDAPSRVGPWLSVAARIRGRRVVYSPYLRATLTSESLEQTWDASDLGAVLAFGDRLGDRALWSAHFRFSMLGGLVSRDPSVESRALAAPDLFVESYAKWLEADRLARRLTRPHWEGPRPTVAILTSVWIHTPANLLAETVECVLKQTSPPDEWIILRNGPVRDDVAAEIARAATASFVRVIDAVDNVGIIGAMRICLTAATTDYVLPLDADDLLEDDALEILVTWAAVEKADLAFSDEDHLANGAFDHPFLRPGFDPVLHTESAYIWHACLVRRERALSVGAYQDAGAEYCHDWDTLLRMAGAGGRIIHVPHLLYHWRTHASSHSNRGQQHPGTLASTRHVLEQTIARTPNPDRYRVATYPHDRGLREFYIERIPAGHPPGLFVRVAETDMPADDTLAPDVPVPVITIQAGDAFAASLGSAVAALPDDAIIHLAGANITGIAAAGVWDAVKLLELHPSVEVVGGRVLDPSRVVIEAGRVCIDQGAWVDPFAGRPAADPGPFALALKPHRIDRPAAGLMAVRVSLLRDLLAAADVASLDDLADACAAACLVRQTRVAYTPLLEGTRHQPATVRPAPLADTRELRARATVLGYADLLPVRHGAAALMRYRLRRKLA